ncbi:tudor domain-containing protein qin isoform X2 [Colletes latitarsis]|uniref:tudor domain-containing protein qin isoform X2 n=1 Tax=Colletes latitarsis TaxID=2605962 RepID=UPI0040367637
MLSDFNYRGEFVPLRGVVPLLLQCGHIICDKCASKDHNKPCPICNTIPQYENSQKVSLPLNMYALGLMVVSHNRPVNTDDSDICFSQSINSKMKKQCMQGLCHECGIQATLKCPQCSALYCQSCYFKIHGRALQNHTKIILAKENVEHAFALQNTCSDRCLEQLGYYCEDCEIAVCPHCMLRLHKKHNYTPLIIKNQELMSQFCEISERLNHSLLRIRHAQKKLKQAVMQPTEVLNTDSIEATITQHFAYLHGVLQNMETKLIDSLHQRRDSKNKDIDEIALQLKEHEERLQSAHVISASITENLDKIDMKKLIQKLEKLTNTPCHLIINSVPENQEIEFHVDESITDAIKNHCTLDIPPVTSFSLLRTELLPDGYEIESLTEENSFPIVKGKPFLQLQPPPVTSVVDIVPRKIDNHLAIGSSEMIRITHIVDPSLFYVHLVQNQSKIAKLTKGLATLVNTTGVIPTQITLNALYIVQCSRDRSWYRGRVTSRKINANNDETYSVMFIDYGMKEDNVPLTRIRNIIPQFAIMPPQALRCALFDIVPNNGQWNADATQAFKKLVCTNSMISMFILMITGDTYYVDICGISSKDSGLISVKDSLTYMKYATCVSQHKLVRTNPMCAQTYFKEHLELEKETGVQVLFVESPSSIYVQKLYANRTYFHKLIREMTENYEQNTHDTDFIPVPCKELPCAARGSDGLWHRGLVCGVTENTVRVFYVDLGYTLTLSYDAIKPLPRKYMSCKTQAIKVSLKNVKPFRGSNNEWEPETNEYLKKLLMNSKPFNLFAFEQINDTYSVLMYTNNRESVTHLLVKNNLAMSTKTSPFGPIATTKRQKKKSNARKQNFNAEIPAQPYGAPNTNVANKTESREEDPFKINVLIQQVHSPDCIYVSDPTYQADIEKMMKEMQNFYREYYSTAEIWSEDAVCAVYLSKTGYYRAQIVKIESKDKVVVFLFDVGIEKTVTIKDIQALCPVFQKIRANVFKIKLTGILPCGGSDNWPSLSCEELRAILNIPNCKFYISKLENEDIENSAIPVELWIKQTKIIGPLAPTKVEINSVNRMLVEKGVALPIKEYAKKRDKILAIELRRHLMKRMERLTQCKSNAKWFKINNEPDNSIEMNFSTNTAQKVLRFSNSSSDSDSDNPNCNLKEIFDNIPSLPVFSTWLPVEPILEKSFIAKPTYLDHNGFLYLHSVEQSQETLQTIETTLEKLYKNCTLESCDTLWSAGDLCIAQYHANKKWYRGKVMKILEDYSIDVQFVDYGNVEECSIGTLKKKIVLQNIPIQCTKCQIDGFHPINKAEKWGTEVLDKVHALLIDQECEVTVLNTTDTHLIIRVTLLPNEYCKRKCNLITFLIDEWKIGINPNDKNSIFEEDDVIIIENSISSCSETELIKDTVLSGCSLLLPNTNIINMDESCTTTDIENLWCEEKDIVSSTPRVVSDENLSINNKLIKDLQNEEFFEIELCCSINEIEFHAQLKENTQSTVLSTYYTQYLLLMNDLQENASKQPMITNIVPNTPCCAKFNDNLWYRCLIVETEPNKDTDNIEIKLLYIDFGNDEYKTVNSQKCELYTMKKEWTDLPAMSIKCKLWNVKVIAPPNSLDILASELEKMYSKRVIATVKEYDEDLICIELYENKNCDTLLYQTLIDKGLFQIKLKNN